VTHLLDVKTKCKRIALWPPRLSPTDGMGEPHRYHATQTFFTFNFARPVRAPWSVFVSRSKMKSALLASQDHMEDHNGHTAVSGARESKERMSIPKVPSSDRRWLRPERGPRLTCKHDGLGERRSSIPGAFKTFSVDHTKSRGRSPLCNRSATSVMCFLSLAVSAGRCC